MRDAIASWCILSLLAAFVWITFRELAERQAKRDRKRQAQTPRPPAPLLTGYWNDAAVDHPHPLHELTVHIDAPDLMSALKALERAS